MARRLDSDEDDKDDVSPKQAANYRGSSKPAGRPKRSLAITRIADKETAEFLARRPRRSGDDLVTHPSPSRQMKVNHCYILLKNYSYKTASVSSIVSQLSHGLKMSFSDP